MELLPLPKASASSTVGVTARPASAVPTVAPPTTASAAAPITAAVAAWPPPALQPVPSSKADRHPLTFGSEDIAELGAAEFAPESPSPLQRRALSSMRCCRDAAVEADGSISPSPEMGSDVRLWRFLVARSFDCAKAGEAYLGALRCVTPRSMKD